MFEIHLFLFIDVGKYFIFVLYYVSSCVYQN